MHTTTRARSSMLTSAVAIALVAATTLPAAADGPVVSEPIADGFAGPLGLAVGHDGTIYVGEAFAGLLTTIDRKGNRDVLVDQSGNEIAGVAATGRGKVVYAQTIFEAGTNPGEPGPVLSATVNRARANGKTRQVFDSLGWEQDRNPDAGTMYGFVDTDPACLGSVPPEAGLDPYPGIIESHPYAVAIVDGGVALADAAGNTIIRIGNNGRAETVAVMPPVEHLVTAELAAEFGLPDCFIGETYFGEFVPTDIEVGPDGDWFVSSLPGFPELPGSGSVWRLDPSTGDMSMVAAGMSGVVDIAVADDGTIYVAELFADQISTIIDGTVSPYVSVPMPGAIEIARDGTLYATTGVFGNGAVVTITP